MSGKNEAYRDEKRNVSKKNRAQSKKMYQYICTIKKIPLTLHHQNQPKTPAQEAKVGDKTMATIYNNYSNDRFAWTEVSKGTKYVTVKELTRLQGHRDITLKFALEDEAAVISFIKQNGGVSGIVEGFVSHPAPISIKYGKTIQ